MLSAGMFSALAARTAVRRRGLPSGSPPPALAAMVISLIRRVKVLPRLASRAPFLCLIVAHLEWPDMGTSVYLEIGRTRVPSEKTGVPTNGIGFVGGDLRRRGVCRCARPSGV